MCGCPDVLNPKPQLPWRNCVNLYFLSSCQVDLVNIGGTDIVDGNHKLTLGLLWSIILHWQVGPFQSLPTRRRKCVICVLVSELCITEHHKLGGFDNRNYFLPILEAANLRSNCQQESFFSAASFLGLWVLLPLVPTWSSFCVCHILILAS